MFIISPNMKFLRKYNKLLSLIVNFQLREVVKNAPFLSFFKIEVGGRGGLEGFLKKKKDIKGATFTASV